MWHICPNSRQLWEPWMTFIFLSVQKLPSFFLAIWPSRWTKKQNTCINQQKYRCFCYLLILLFNFKDDIILMRIITFTGKFWICDFMTVWLLFMFGLLFLAFCNYHFLFLTSLIQYWILLFLLFLCYSFYLILK